MTILASQTLCKNQLNSVTSANFTLTGGRITGWFWNIQVDGTFNGATITINASSDGGSTWTPVTGGAFTAAAFQTIQLKDCLLHAVTSGGDSGTSLSIYLT